MGTWTIPATAQPPVNVSMSPSSGAGTTQTFTFTAASASGYGNIAYMQIIVNSAASCFFGFSPPNNIYINNPSDAGGVAYGTLGSSGTIQNSQCSLNLAASSAVGTSNNLALNLAITFKSGLQGQQSIYMSAGDNAGLTS